MNGGPTPRVSFLLAVYNIERFLPATLDGIFAQTFTDFEVVAVDDASTDGTARILQSTGDPRLRYVRNESNVGQVPSLIRGTALCRGEFVARIDGDDVCEPQRLAAQVRYLNDHPNVAGCATWTTEIDEQDAVIGAVEPCGDVDYVRWSMCHTLRLYHPTMTVRRRAIEDGGGYDAAYPATEDYELWTRLVAAGKRLGVVEQRLVRYRRRAGSITDTNRELQRSVGRRIATRYVGAVLGRAADEQTVGLMKALLSWERLDPATSPGKLAGVLSLMADLRRRTLGTASARARAAADAEVSGHLLRQGRFLLKDGSSLSARIGRYVTRLPGHRAEGLKLLLDAVRCAAGRMRRGGAGGLPQA